MGHDSHGDVVIERDGVRAVVLDAHTGVDEAVALLDRVEATAGVPLVDESERRRLRDLAGGVEGRHDHWHSVVALRGASAVGYAGVVCEDGHGDVAVDRTDLAPHTVMEMLLEAAERLASGHRPPRLDLWVRHADRDDVRCAVDAGFAIARRLGVFSRPLPAPAPATPPPAPDADVAIRPFRAGDADAVVEILALAYDGTPDGGWTRERLDERRSHPWYRDEDLLVAEVGGELAGIHWTKRRGDGVGEVYNLAVDPRRQGSGLGAVLLAAGLRHLAEVGCREVLLWVDLANERAVRLYVRHGFRILWEDLALTRTVLPAG